MKKSFSFFILLTVGIYLYGQNEPIIIEAENGTIGSDFDLIIEDDIEYIAPKTNFINSAFPGSEDKVVTFTVNFQDAGMYKLFARINVGPQGADDDSFFYGNGFGKKNPTSEFDWIMCNNLNVAGYTILTDVVEEQGDATTGIWKWVALSDYTGGEAPLIFSVQDDGLVQTFEFGAREDGMRIDKIAFGKKDIYYTVDDLNNGQAGSETHPGIEYKGPPLATGLDKFLGCVHSRGSKRDVTEYWNQLTPGNAGKWGWVEGRRDTMVWTELDEAYYDALDNGYVYKHHVMVWGAQQPAWIADLDSAEQRAELKEWFAAVAERYPGIDQVEVVNEPLHNAPDADNEGNYINALGGKGKSGWDWILESFRMAREVFGDATVLMINEYNIMNSISNTDKYLEIIRLLQAENLIDAIGFQAHGFSHKASNETILRNLDTLASTGLPLYATELDIDGLTDFAHVHNYMNLFPLLWEHPAIKGITLWGFKPAMWRGDQGCYLIDETGQERPAMTWLRAYLKNEFIPNQTITISSASGKTTVENIGDTIRLIADLMPANSTIKDVYWRVSRESVASIDQNGVLTALNEGTVTVTAKSLEFESSVGDALEITIGKPSSESNTFSFSNDFVIYPNPAINGNFTIERMNGITHINIIDLQGKQVSSFVTAGKSKYSFGLDIPDGIYILKMFSSNEVYYEKIIVK